jgi:hypothetical protein
MKGQIPSIEKNLGLSVKRKAQNQRYKKISEALRCCGGLLRGVLPAAVLH